MQSPDPVSSPQSAQFSQFGYFLFSATNLVFAEYKLACLHDCKEGGGVLYYSDGGWDWVELSEMPSCFKYT